MIKHIAVDKLNSAKRNARTHSKKQIKQIAKSIETFGFIGNILIDVNNRIIAGHGRLEAAMLLNMESVPTLCISHLSEAEIRAYALADNKLAELAGWDDSILVLEFQELSGLDLSFELEDTGFSMQEINMFVDFDVSGQEPSDEDDYIEYPNEEVPAVCKEGDIWKLGRHKLYVGDALIKVSYERLMGPDRAQMIFTDPPYNVPIEGHVTGKGGITKAPLTFNNRL